MSPRSLTLHGAVAALAFLVAGCGGESREALPEAPSPTVAESTAPAGAAAWVDGLPVGPPPAIGYVVGDVYHSPGGGMVRLPATGGIQPAVPQRARPEVRARRNVLAVVGGTDGDLVARLATPGPWLRGHVRSAAWEDRARLLVSLERDFGQSAAIVRVDVRTGRWELAVDWTPLEETASVSFDTRP